MDQELSVKDFGAVGNGSTDDTAALQKALDAAKGRRLLIDAGQYRISKPLLVSSGTTLEGVGAASVLIFTWADQQAGPAFHLGNKHRGNDEPGDSKIVLADFVLQGGSNGRPYGEDDHSVTHGISFRKVRDVEVRGLTIRHTSGFAIANTGIVRGNFHDNMIRDVGRDGITSFPLIDESQAGFDNHPLSDLRVWKNDIRNVGDDGIAVHAGTTASVNRRFPPTNIAIFDNTIVGRTVDDPNGQGRGICLSGAVDARITNNEIRRTVSTGILIQDWGPVRSKRITIEGNKLFDPGRSPGLKRVKFGMQIKGADDVHVRRNKILRAGDRGMDIRDATQVEVTNNVVDGSGGQSAITVAGGAGAPTRDVSLIGNVLVHHVEPALMLHQAQNVREANNVQRIKR